MNVKIKRYLKNERTQLKPVIFRISFGFRETNPISGEVVYKPLVYNSYVKVSKADWDDKSSLPMSAKDSAEIMRMEGIIKNTFEYMCNNDMLITPESMAFELDRVFDRSTKKSSDVVYIADYIENVMEKDPKRTPSNKKHYKCLKHHIQDFEKQIGSELSTKNLNKELYLAFMDKIRSLMGTANGVWKIQKDLKSTLNEIRRNFPHLTVFDPVNALKSDEKAKAVVEDKVFMNFEQIQAVLEYEPQSEKLKNTKLILIMLLFSGCRYSDVFKLIPEHEYNKDGIRFRYARFIDQKTAKDIVVPFLKPIEDALKQNKGELPYPITDVKFNLFVKELVELAELKESVTLSFTNPQGKKEHKVKRFYEYVSSHIGRRSFVTNFINYIPVTILSKITGHALTNNNVIFSYNKISLLDNAVLFIKELKRVCENNKNEFPLKLV